MSAYSFIDYHAVPLDSTSQWASDYSSEAPTFTSYSSTLRDNIPLDPALSQTLLDSDDDTCSYSTGHYPGNSPIHRASSPRYAESAYSSSAYAESPYNLSTSSSPYPSAQQSPFLSARPLDSGSPPSPALKMPPVSAEPLYVNVSDLTSSSTTTSSPNSFDNDEGKSAISKSLPPSHRPSTPVVGKRKRAPESSSPYRPQHSVCSSPSMASDSSFEDDESDDGSEYSDNDSLYRPSRSYSRKRVRFSRCTDEDDEFQFVKEGGKKSRGRRVPVASEFKQDDHSASSAGVLATPLASIPYGIKKVGAPQKNKRRYICTFEGCGKCFVRGEHLKRHVKSLHLYEKPHQCPLDGCTKSFSRKDNLKQHIRAFH